MTRTAACPRQGSYLGLPRFKSWIVPLSHHNSSIAGETAHLSFSKPDGLEKTRKGANVSSPRDDEIKNRYNKLETDEVNSLVLELAFSINNLNCFGGEGRRQAPAPAEPPGGARSPSPSVPVTDAPARAELPGGARSPSLRTPGPVIIAAGDRRRPPAGSVNAGPSAAEARMPTSSVVLSEGLGMPVLARPTSVSSHIAHVAPQRQWQLRRAQRRRRGAPPLRSSGTKGGASGPHRGRRPGRPRDLVIGTLPRPSESGSHRGRRNLCKAVGTSPRPAPSGAGAAD